MRYLVHQVFQLVPRDVWSWGIDSGLAASFQVGDDEIAPYLPINGSKVAGYSLLF
jgi:hypothetical protein